MFANPYEDDVEGLPPVSYMRGLLATSSRCASKTSYAGIYVLFLLFALSSSSESYFTYESTSREEDLGVRRRPTPASVHACGLPPALFRVCPLCFIHFGTLARRAPVLARVNRCSDECSAVSTRDADNRRCQ